MSDLATLKRGRGGPRAQCVQGWLSMEFGEEPCGGDGTSEAPEDEGRRPGGPFVGHAGRQERSGPPSISHPPAYRGVIAGWPRAWRERWGRRSNELEDAGLAWRDAEARAFAEVWSQLRQEHREEETAGARTSVALRRPRPE